MLKNAYLLAKIGADTAENERVFSCEIVVGSWVGISQVKIKSRLSRSALLPFVLRMIAETPSNVIQWMELGNLLYRFRDSVSRGYL